MQCSSMQGLCARLTGEDLSPCCIYMSQAWKRDLERDKEVWSFHSIWGSGMDAGRCTDKPWQFQCTCLVLFLLENSSR